MTLPVTTRPAVAGATVVANPLAGPPPLWSPYGRGPVEFHRRLPGYEVTPLISAPALAQRLGVGRLLIKTETARFGLPAFKMLGASWASYRALVERLGQEPAAWANITELSGRLQRLRPFALAAATDGNHGRAVARMARWLGFGAHIFVPEGTAVARIQAISDEGASVTVVRGDYEDAVARSAEEAGWRCLVISDTGWPGYEMVPRWVIEGYSTMFWEVDDRLEASATPAPDVVVVPVGVGALAAATVNHWGRKNSPPAIAGVEPLDANCVMQSALAGRPVVVPGPHLSVMAGLNCGTPSPVAWPLVSAGLSTLIAVDDEMARQAVRDLAAIGVAAGETGAAALAGLSALPAWPAKGNALAPEGTGGRPLTGATVLPAATVLVVCTEGPTDPAEWRRTLGIELI
ncbi:MAG TPA: diaminopropionate ammonia-lyase [Acidimicrobiales bacterium]|nr:diaminopropionate ammonia-lyase [Acidimicrobiales bacterium]